MVKKGLLLAWMRGWRWWFVSCVWCCGLHEISRAHSRQPHASIHVEPVHDPSPTKKSVSCGGYGLQSEIYYSYWEADETGYAAVPIVLWLQGGPGCASTFGGFYELGPYLINDDLELVENPGAWTQSAGLLLLDQPVGTGFSVPALNSNKLGMAFHLYAALQAFFSLHIDLSHRPLFIAGESYASKYVPSIAHYILQALDMAASLKPAQRARQLDSSAILPSLDDIPRGSGASALESSSQGKLKLWRKLPESTKPPVFTLAGVAIGIGLTDPRTQVQTMADVAFFQGLIPPGLRKQVQDAQQDVVTLIACQARGGRWGQDPRVQTRWDSCSRRR